jgi:signal transduction histidine kinase
MLRSLRLRLALSHAIPVLLFVALLGTLLLYQLERSYFLDSLAAELAGQGAIIANFTREEPQIWVNPELAQFAIEQLQSRITAQIMLIDARGRVVAASWFDTEAAVGQRVDSMVVNAALQGRSTWSINNSVILQGQALDVAVPVMLDSRRILGVVRLSHNLTEIQRRLAPLRGLVWLMLGLGATLSLLLGLALAQSFAAPLRRLAEVVSRFRPTAPLEAVPEVGPTEIRTVATAFNQMGARLIELEESRRALLTGIVHELGRPLGAIKAAAQTIRKNPNPDLSVELATGIDDQIEQLRLQVEDLALLSELEYQGLRMNFGPVDIGELVEQQSRNALLNATDRGINLSWTVNPMLPLITGDSKRISLIVDNLIHNALKYTPSGGAVHINAFSDPPAHAHNGHNGEPSYVDITVSDNGPGIAEVEQEKIFQLFYRSPAQLRRHQGMGIGLALARQLAEAHGGTLTVQSDEGYGTTFTLRLPLVPPALVPV